MDDGESADTGAAKSGQRPGQGRPVPVRGRAGGVRRLPAAGQGGDPQHRWVAGHGQEDRRVHR